MHRIIARHLNRIADLTQGCQFPAEDIWPYWGQKPTFFGLFPIELRKIVSVAHDLYHNGSAKIPGGWKTKGGSIRWEPLLVLLGLSDSQIEDILKPDPAEALENRELNLLLNVINDRQIVVKVVDNNTQDTKVCLREVQVPHFFVPSCHSVMRYDLLVNNPLQICFSAFKAEEENKSVMVSCSELRLNPRQHVAAAKFIFKLFNAAAYGAAPGEQLGAFLKGTTSLKSRYMLTNVLARSVSEFKSDSAYLMDFPLRELRVTQFTGKVRNARTVYSLNDRASDEPYQIHTILGFPDAEEVRIVKDAAEAFGLMDDYQPTAESRFTTQTSEGDITAYISERWRAGKLELPYPLLKDFVVDKEHNRIVFQLIDPMNGKSVYKLTAERLPSCLTVEEGGTIEPVLAADNFVDKMIFQQLFREVQKKSFTIKRADGERFTLAQDVFLSMTSEISGLPNAKDVDLYLRSVAAQTTQVNEIVVRPKTGPISAIQGFAFEVTGIRN